MKEHKVTLADVEHVFYLDHGEGICPNSSNCIHEYMQFFVYQLYLNKAVKKKKESV